MFMTSNRYSELTRCVFVISDFLRLEKFGETKRRGGLTAGGGGEEKSKEGKLKGKRVVNAQFNVKCAQRDSCVKNCSVTWAKERSPLVGTNW